MDTPTSAVPDEKTPPPDLALATQLGKEKSSPSGPPEISAAVARLTSNSIDELHKLVSELQKMQEFLKSEVDNVQRQIDSAVAGINIIVETETTRDPSFQQRRCWLRNKSRHAGPSWDYK